MNDLIDRQAAIDAAKKLLDYYGTNDISKEYADHAAERFMNRVPSAEPERLTDDDFEIIRIHLNAIKEKLCNQQRWKEAEEYQRIIDRFVAFASAEPKRKTGKWNFIGNQMFECSECGTCYTQSQFYQMRVRISDTEFPKFCPNCGADMRGDIDG